MSQKLSTWQDKNTFPVLEGVYEVQGENIFAGEVLKSYYINGAWSMCSYDNSTSDAIKNKGFPARIKSRFWRGLIDE